jgi:hypothetical protein
MLLCRGLLGALSEEGMKGSRQRAVEKGREIGYRSCSGLLSLGRFQVLDWLHMNMMPVC